MQIKLKNVKNLYKTLAVLSFLALLVSVFAIFVSDVVMPLSVALVALVLLLEVEKKKVFSAALIVMICIANLVSLFILCGFMISGVETVILGFILYLAFSKNLKKSETAFIISAVAVIFILINAASFAVAFKGELAFDVIKIFYIELYDAIKQGVVSSLDVLNSSIPEGSAQMLLSASDLVALLDASLPLIVSLVALMGFAVAGFTLKLFSLIAVKLEGNREMLTKWRFRTDSLFAYIYIALFVLQIFTMGSSDLFSIAVLNLFYVFGAVYAYLGFNFALSLLSYKRSPAFAFIILIIGLLLFSTLMIEILSVVGVFVTISENKALSKK